MKTSNVQMGEYDISTPERVDFRWGPHFGSGRQMHMRLLPREGGGRGNQLGSNVGGLESVEMSTVERLHLDLSKAKMPAGQVPAAPAGPAAGSMAGMPIDITCRGPFRFDLVRRLATFDSDVKVARDSPRDQATC